MFLRYLLSVVLCELTALFLLLLPSSIPRESHSAIYTIWILMRNDDGRRFGGGSSATWTSRVQQLPLHHRRRAGAYPKIAWYWNCGVTICRRL